MNNTYLNQMLRIKLSFPIAALVVALALAGCSVPSMVVPDKIAFEHSPKKEISSILGDEKKLRTYSESNTPKPPVIQTGNISSTPPVPEVEGKNDLIVAFDQMPLPTFIQAVYGVVLKTNYAMDAAVSARTDLVTFRAPKPQSAAKIAVLTRLLLKSYGIAVQDFGGLIRLVPDNATTSYSPQIRRGRAQPDVPVGLRPVFHYIELEAVRTSEFSHLLRSMFGTKIKIEDDAAHNALLLSGPPEDISAALEIVPIFDQPVMRGQRSKRVSPVFWTAEEFSRRLTEVLTAEGYAASSQVGSATPILILPIAPLNSVIIFASSEAILDHALTWARELDRPSESQAGGAYFTYPVKYADAQDLAKTLSELISSPSAPAVAGVAPGKRASKIVVNNATNSLIIQGGGADEYRQWMALLAELDKPTKSALIDVVVAEVTLNDSNSLGIDWTFQGVGAVPSGARGLMTAATAGATGLNMNFVSKDGFIKAKLSALASKNDAQILSSPKIMARNGETATIQVGDEVPIITSQQNAASPGAFGAPSSGVLSTVQYRTTGVILKVRPVINSGNRIDLDISQEVSNAKLTQTGVSISPTISTRKFDTKLSLRDGSTVLLAGLITNNTNDTDSGVPLLKDIPGLGNLFKTTTKSKNKTELVILITTYIINDDFEAESITTAFENTLGDWANNLKDRKPLHTTHALNGMTDELSMPPVSDKNQSTQVTTSKKEEPLPAKTLSNDNPPLTPNDASDSKTAAPPLPVPETTATSPPSEDVSDGIVMSKPAAATPVTMPPTPSPSGSSNTQKKAGNQGSTTNLPAGLKPVEDPALLQELRRASGLK